MKQLSEPIKLEGETFIGFLKSRAFEWSFIIAAVEKDSESILKYRIIENGD